MIALALVNLVPLPEVTIFVTVAFTLSGLGLKASVGALTVPPTVTTSRGFALASVLAEPQAARNTRGMTAADTIRKRDRRTRGPLIVGTGIPSTISPHSVWSHPERSYSSTTCPQSAVRRVHRRPRTGPCTGRSAAPGR